MDDASSFPLTAADLKQAIALEGEHLEKAYRWVESHMPPSFLEEVNAKAILLIARNLLSFQLQNRFSSIQIGQTLYILCMDAPDADLKILHRFKGQSIRYYRAFVSNAPPPQEKVGALRIAIVCFLDDSLEQLPLEEKNRLFALAKEAAPSLQEAEFHSMLQELSPRFLRALTEDRLKIAIEMFFRAKTRDQCQYEVRKTEDWKQKQAPSLQLILAWRNVPKAGFLFRLSQIIDSHGLALQKMAATYIDPYSVDNIMILSLGIHGIRGKAAWEEADIEDLLREICLLKYFEAEDAVATTFVQPHLATGNEGHLIRNFISFVHQTLDYVDPNLYSFSNIVEGVCRHPELLVKLCSAFEAKFHPEKHDATLYQKIHQEIVPLIERLDTGQAQNDERRKNILRQVLSFIDHTLKTNFYRHNKSAFSFRLDPKYLDHVPYERKEKFPELPFGIFFVRGMHFLGFQIRFKDLARGGIRTVIPERWEQYYHERNNIFSEAYNLSYTQQKKNKDIPEGGAKTAILLKPFEVFAKEEKVYRKELLLKGMEPSIVEEKIKIYRKEHRHAYIFASQRAFIESLLSLVNCDDEGNLKAKSIVDYYKKPEYLYAGPDENSFNEMITWIAKYAEMKGYKPGRSFMSSKPGAGINHKEYGVTSFGIHVYLQHALLALGIDPKKDPFTIKISGGPDGDVAGNEMLNLYRDYPKTAKVIAITDVSGTIYDPGGLSLEELQKLFHQALPIRHYPAKLLSDKGFLLDLRTKREEKAYAQQTLLLKKEGDTLVEEWLSGNDMNLLYRNNLHQVYADVFIPGGGRPRTLNETNYTTYLDEAGKPTSKAIIEGANLYLTPEARRALEKLGVLIFKDSSCNKGGVICSSLEVLAGLCMTEEEFLEHKQTFIQQALQAIGRAAKNEAQLLLDTHKTSGQFLTDLSDKVSERINKYKYQLLDYLLETEEIDDPTGILEKALFAYCPPLLRDHYREALLHLPPIHKKAIIACYLASHLVYKRGLEWRPTLADILPALAKEASGLFGIE